jgi:hypothetical protein
MAESEQEAHHHQEHLEHHHEMHEDPGQEEVEVEGEEYDDDPMSVRDPGNTKQLTLSYQGEVYVFDTVPPEKVREQRRYNARLFFVRSLYSVFLVLWCLWT